MGSLQIHAQTKPIAYKSHAGDMDFFLPEHQPEDDFGNPPPRIIKFVKINDSTVVEMLDDWGYGILDTVVNHPHFQDPNASTADIKKKYGYPKDTEFIGFDKKEKPTKKTETTPIEEIKTPEDNKPKACPAPIEELKKRKKGKKKKEKKQDQASTSIIPANNNFPPNNPGSSVPLLLSLVAAYLCFLGFLVWKRQREKIFTNAG